MQVITEKMGMDTLIRQVAGSPLDNGAGEKCCIG